MQQLHCCEPSSSSTNCPEQPTKQHAQHISRCAGDRSCSMHQEDAFDEADEDVTEAEVRSRM